VRIASIKKPTTQFPDFQKNDFRVGEIKEAIHVEGSKNLIKMKVDLGEDYGIVEVLSGILDWYKPEELVGNKYAFLANLEPKKIMGFESQGMMLVVDDPKKPYLVKIPKKFKNGLSIY
jgi:methionine--tRNA ligase beta chain